MASIVEELQTLTLVELAATLRIKEWRLRFYGHVKAEHMTQSPAI